MQCRAAPHFSLPKATCDNKKHPCILNEILVARCIVMCFLESCIQTTHHHSFDWIGMLRGMYNGIGIVRGDFNLYLSLDCMIGQDYFGFEYSSILADKLSVHRGS